MGSILGREQLIIIDHFGYLGSFVTRDGSTTLEICTHMYKARGACDEPKH